MSNPNILKGRIYQVIFEHGPKTYLELKVYIPDIRERLFAQCINNDKRRNQAKGENVFRISGYHRNLGKKGDMSPIFDLGPGPDAEKPTVEATKEAGQRRDARKRIQVNKVLTDTEKEVALAELHAYQLAEANREVVQAKRSALVFSSMFGGLPPVVAVETKTKRIYKTSNQEPNPNGKTQSNLSAHLQTDRRERTDVTSGHCG